MGPESKNSTEEEEISPIFKLQWLNTTLKFIKNDSELILKYPELSLHKIQFLQGMINGNNYDIELGYRQLYVPLWEAIKIFGLKYEFKMRVQHIGNNSGYLILEKVPKSPREDVSSDSDISEPTVSNSFGKRVLSKKYMVGIKRTIDSVTPAFIKSSLQMLLDFVIDEEQASINFDDLARVEVIFLQQVLGVVKRRKSLEEFFSPICNRLLEKIDIGLDKSSKFRIESAPITVNPETSKRQMMFKKIPQFSKKSKTKKPKSAKKQKMKCDIEEKINSSTTVNSPKVNDSTKLDTMFVKEKVMEMCIELKSDILGTTDKPSPILNTKKDVIDKSVKSIDFINNNVTMKANLLLKSIENSAEINKTVKNSIKSNESKTEMDVSLNKPSLSKEIVEEKSFETLIAENKHIPKNNINICNQSLKMEGSFSDNKEPKSVTIDKTGGDKMETETKSVDRQLNKTIEKSTPYIKTIDKRQQSPIHKMDTSKLPKVKVKLMEGLSTPVESNIAIRMMKSMGWDGGALGAREGGIMEPIMPNIHLAKNAGLGHVKKEEIKEVKNIKEDNKKNKPPKTTRTDVLQAILNSLNNDSNVFVTELKSALSKKDKQYINQINRALNTRSDTGVTKKDDLALIECIQDVLKVNPSVKFFVVPQKKRLIRIEKLVEKVHKLPPELRERTKEEFNENTTEDLLTREEIEKKIYDYINDSNNNENDFLTKEECALLICGKEKELNSKSLSLLKDRLFIMKKCLKFLKSDEKDIVVCAHLNLRSRNFVKHICGFVNRRKASLITGVEKIIWSEIQKHIGVCFLIHTIDDGKFTFSKVYRLDTNKAPAIETPNSKETTQKTSDETEKQENNEKFSLSFSKNAQNDNNEVFYFGNKEKIEVIDKESCDERIDNLDVKETNMDVNSNDCTDSVLNSKITVTDVIVEKPTKVASIEKKEIKNVRIMKQSQTMTAETAKQIQNQIWNTIKNSTLESLPALKCHGIKNDSLLYSCFDHKTYEWITELLKEYQIIEYESDFKMALNIRAYDEDINILSCLKLFYSNLNIEKWRIEEKTYSEINLRLTVLMDEDSFKFICDNKFSLYAGIDEVTFDIV